MPTGFPTTKLPNHTRFAFILFAVFALFAVSLGATVRPNILMIVVDDLKPNIGAYGNEYAITPALDRLATQGTVFLNNHCQQAVCGASRASALTGMRPDTVQVWDFQARMRDQLPDLVTLPQYFKQQGYHTASLGKVFDPRCCDGEANDDASWSQPHWTASTPHLADNYFGDPEIKRRLAEGEERARAAGLTDNKEIRQYINYFPTTECMAENVPDNFYGDGLRTDRAVELLEELGNKDDPFFLAVGYKKPHLPFVAPKKYWDLYDRNSLPQAEVQQMPEGAPYFHFQDSWELRSGYAPIPEGILPEDMQREMIHGYYACISYIDAQVDRLLDTLRNKGLAENTIIVLWGDHGWHLGDHGMWCKHTNYEQATRSPLIIVDPRLAQPVAQTSRPTEFVDIAPTLAAMAGLPVPESFAGQSLLPLMKGDEGPFKEFAISQFARSHNAPNNLMGYAFRNERYRLILWIEMAYKAGERSGPLVATELYDYQSDPLETRNLAHVTGNEALLAGLMESARAFSARHLEIQWEMDPQKFLKP